MRNTTRNRGRGVTLRAHASQQISSLARVRTQGDAPTPIPNGSPRNDLFRGYRNCVVLGFFIALSILSGNINTGVYATSPYYAMTFSITNFNSQFLLADANDLSDPTNSFFQLKNGTHLWYAIAIKSRPTGISPTPANQTGDLIATTFFGKFPLLPPAQILPFDQRDNSYPYEIIKLQAS